MFLIVSRGLLFSLAIKVLMIAQVQAANITWSGNNNDWLDGIGNNGNWSPADEPDSDDTAIFNTSNAVNLTSNNAILALTLSGGINLSTNSFNLDVNGLVQLTDANTTLTARGATSQLTADSTTINNFAKIELDLGTITINEESGNGLLDINANGELRGHGTVNMTDALGAITSLIVNDGSIIARRDSLVLLGPPQVGTLSINASNSNARIDLDGASGGGIVQVLRNQTLDINIQLSDGFSGAMTLTHSATLDMSSAWTLDVGSINVDNGFVDNPGLIPDVPAGTSTIAGAALTQTAGSTITVVDTDGTLQFNGTFDMTGGNLINNGLVVFNNNATIGATANITMPTTTSSLSVGASRTVTINQANFNLDGSNSATNVITVSDDGELTINTTDYDPDSVTNVFDGTVNLTNATIDITTSDAEFIMDGVLNSQASGSKQSLWTGEALDIGNDAGALDAKVNISGSQPTQFGAQVDFNSDADLNVTDGATAHFLDTVNFNSVNGGNNAEFTGSGELIFSAGVNFSETTHLNMVGGTVDLDGADSIGDTLNIDAPLTIHAELMRSFGKNNGGGGVNLLDVNNSANTGTLTVILDNANDEWTLNAQGVINLVNDNTEVTLLAGSDVNVNGTVNVTGDVRTTARLDIAGVININTAAQPLRLAGGNESTDVNTIAGGTVNGVGILGADTGKALHGFGTINTQIDFDGSADLMADNGTLNIDGTKILDVETLGTADADGVLNVANAWNNNVTAGVQLRGGTLSGGTMTNDATAGISGHGLVTARVINNTQLFASLGDSLIFQTAANDNDWDGSTNIGEIEAVSANIEIRDNATFAFTGTVRVSNSHTAFANGFGLDFNPGSTLELLNAGTYRSSSSTDIGGTVTVGAGTATIQVTNNFFLTFETGSSTTLASNLTLMNNNINIEQGATFSGGGGLIIPDGSHMVADHQANIGVLLEMHGALRPGNFNGIGRVELLDYQQTDTGELYVELIGTSLNQFDRLVLSGDAVIDGYLNIDIDEVSPGVPFVPTAGQTFNIITGNTVTGTFDYYDISGMPAGLTGAGTYLSNAVQLEVVNKAFFSADFDEDGDVDLTDLAIWEGAFNLNQLGDANGDNRSDLSDWSLWRDQWGSTTGPGGVPQPVPEPGACGLAILAAAAVGFRSRLRRFRFKGLKRIAACLIALLSIQTLASAAPTLNIINNGMVGPDRQWLVQVGPDPALFTGGTGPVGAELAIEVLIGELVSVTKNAIDWPHNLPSDNNPFSGGSGSNGLQVNLADDTIFAPVGSKLFNSGSLSTVLTIVTQGSGPTTIKWGGYSITAPNPDYISCRLAQNGVNFDGYQGLISTNQPGDFDSDGDVDGADFIVWQTNFPAANGHALATGDADGDTDVDGADFAAWKSSFPSSPGPGTSPVPEPAGLLLVAMSAAVCTLIYRRKARSV